MKGNDYNYEETLSIRQYNVIINMASNRIRFFRSRPGNELTRPIDHAHIQRDINMIRHCRRMIKLIQEQLN